VMVMVRYDVRRLVSVLRPTRGECRKWKGRLDGAGACVRVV
jgi:hypothetical protein